MPAISHAADQVSLQLRWYNQFQFAGYYMAVEKGFYQEQDINVDILAGGKGKINSVTAVLQHKAQFGVSNSSSIINYLNNDPIIAVAAISQTSPLVWITLKSKNIRIVQDLPGHKLMTLPEPQNSELFSLLKQESIPIESVEIIPTSFDINDLITGKVDAYNGYISNEPYYLKQKNIDFHLIKPRDYGINFYNDVLITHKQLAKDNPDLVKRFKQASLKGWEYALNNIEESVDIIAKKYAKNKSHDHLLYEAEVIKESILPDLVEIGHMNPGRWENIINVYKDLGIVNKSKPSENFIFNYVEKQNYFFSMLTTAISLIVLIISGITIYHFRKLSLALKRSNQELASLAISDPLTGIMNRRGFIENAERMISLESRQKNKICLLLLDIDFFKKINDQYGHHVGDFCLIEFTEIIQSCCRMHDLVARVGGEEFIILLSDCDTSQARDKANYIVQRVREHSFKPNGIENTINVTVSIGVTEIKSNLSIAWQQADEALYAVKNSGRNGLQIYLPTS
jgi:diguanylate cyclase (GGDEF)-like protein